MRTKKCLLWMVAAIVLTACNANYPSQPADQLLPGRWQVNKQKVTGLYYNAQGEPVHGTRDLPLFDTIVYTFYDSTMNSTMIMPNGGCWAILYPYSIQALENGQWLVTIPGLYDIVPGKVYDTMQNMWNRCSPIRIYKITATEMEWEYVAYGGDEGPDTYYQYLKRVNVP